MTLRDSGWVLSVTIFHNPEVIGQPEGTTIWWGFGLYPDRDGDYIRKRMTECTGAEILEEVVRHLKFDGQLAAIMTSSICDATVIPSAASIPQLSQISPYAFQTCATGFEAD